MSRAEMIVTETRPGALYEQGEEMKEFDERLNVAWWALRIGLGLGPILAGIDKYFNILADWGMYLNPLATRVLPVSASTFMHVVGVVEVIAGAIMLSRWTKIGSYIVMGWLVAIAVNLVSMGMFYDLAVRDVEIAIGAFTLAQLTAVREQSTIKSTTTERTDSRIAFSR
jgi:uncharacterized membrane protein YphA (DoxX/SURF4 family)